MCPCCGKQAQWVDNSQIYGRRYGKSYMAYLCRDCDAYVGCHNNTRDPLGTMANKELRNARCAAHAVLDQLWKSREMTRGDVYRWLAKTFGYDVHIGGSDLQQCQAIINAVHNRKQHATDAG